MLSGPSAGIISICRFATVLVTAAALLCSRICIAQNGAQVTLRSSTGSFSIPRSQAFTLTADTRFSPGCSGAHASHTWTVDGTIAATHGHALVLRFGVEGSHVVGCQVVADEGCNGGSTVTIYSIPGGGGDPGGGGGGGGSGCTFSAGATPNPACVNQGITFTAGYTGQGCPTIGSWKFDDDNFATAYPGQTVVHAFSNPGAHIGRVTDSGGVTQDVSVQVNTPGILGLQASGSPTTACINGPIQFSASAHESCGSGTISYSWSFDGAGSTPGQSVSHAFASSGPHTATVEASDGVNPPQQQTVMVQVNAPAILLTAAANPTTACPGADITFSASASDACAGYTITYSWKFDGGPTIYTGQNVHQSFTIPGMHTAEVTATDGTATSTASTSVNITAPSLSVSIGAPTPASPTACDEMTFTPAASGQCFGAVSYSWRVDGLSISGSPNPLKIKLSPGQRVIEVTAASGGLTATASRTVTVQNCTLAKALTPGKGPKSSPWIPASCPFPVRVNGWTGNVKATKPDPVATRGYPLVVNIHFDSQAVEFGRPMGNASFTYDIHLTTQTVYDTNCGGTLHRMLVDGDATRHDFGLASGGLVAPAGFYAQLSVNGSGWILQHAGPPEDIGSAGNFLYAFDSLGRLTQITDPAGNVQTLSYGGPNGQLSLVTDANTGKQAAFYYTGSRVSQVVENGTVATNLTYSGNLLAGIGVSNGMQTVESVQATYAGTLLATLQRDNDPASAVTFTYSQWPSTDCASTVALANATDANGRATGLDWSQPAAAGAASSVYRTNAKGGQFRYDFGGVGDLIRVDTDAYRGFGSQRLHLRL